MNNEEKIYQRIGEFVVSVQWIENLLREIGRFILNPDRTGWPPTGPLNLTNEKLIDSVHRLFVEALPKCRLGPELEAEYKASFESCVKTLHKLRRDRTRILNSAFFELKAGGDVQGIMRSTLADEVDAETGERLFDQELLTPESFSKEMDEIANAALVLNRAYLQLIHRYPGSNVETVVQADNHVAPRLNSIVDPTEG